VEACPTEAISTGSGLTLDLGRCVFCAECVAACPAGSIRLSTDPRMAASAREDLVLRGAEPNRARALGKEMRRLFGRSLRLREVCAGSCNGCELELQALSNVVFDLARFGIQFVASPRHADGLVVTGPVTENMRAALLDTYAAVPAPKIVIAVGACAISGGPFRGSPEVHDGVEGILPVDLYVPGCPPHPITLLDGMLRLLGRIGEDGGRAPA
jgi:Ni,Fe-hydrogenase III small subunit